MTSILLTARSITKTFPGVLAVDGVAVSADRGEVVAVVGENGAGKSTLMKILAGIETPDRGEIHIDGEEVTLRSPRDAESRGIALIHQELNLADNLTVAANISLGREAHRFGIIDRREIDRRAEAILESLDLRVKPRTPLAALSIGQRQMVEVARALAADARVLIMDEPTSSLSQTEVAKLFTVIRELRERGVAILYISHRLGEVKALADRVVVLRDGRNAGELGRDEISHDAMVRLMVGRDVSQFYPRTQHMPGEVALRIRGLRTEAHPQHAVSFEVRRGEIVGVAGLVGAGRSELLRALFGVDRAMGGSIEVAGRPARINSPVDAIGAGLCLVPEDRKAQGLILEMTLRSNVSLAGLGANARAMGLRPLEYERRVSRDMLSRLGVRAPHDRCIAAVLSGGNQQKVVLAKWLAMQPKVLLLDEPTRGIDVGAKQEIYRLMEMLASQGVAILFASSEMEEILGMSDRALVMHEGRLAGEVARDELTEEAVISLATGREMAVP